MLGGHGFGVEISRLAFLPWPRPGPLAVPLGTATGTAPPLFPAAQAAARGLLETSSTVEQPSLWRPNDPHVGAELCPQAARSDPGCTVTPARSYEDESSASPLAAPAPPAGGMTAFTGHPCGLNSLPVSCKLPPGRGLSRGPTPPGTSAGPRRGPQGRGRCPARSECLGGSLLPASVGGSAPRAFQAWG